MNIWQQKATFSGVDTKLWANLRRKIIAIVRELHKIWFALVMPRRRCPALVKLDFFLWTWLRSYQIIRTREISMLHVTRRMQQIRSLRVYYILFLSILNNLCTAVIVSIFEQWFVENGDVPQEQEESRNYRIKNFSSIFQFLINIWIF